jgi:hypothetical protein
MGTICFAKPVLLDTVYSAKEGIFNNMLNLLYVLLTKAKHIHKRQPHLVVSEDIT